MTHIQKSEQGLLMDISSSYPSNPILQLLFILEAGPQNLNPFSDQIICGYFEHRQTVNVTVHINQYRRVFALPDSNTPGCLQDGQSQKNYCYKKRENSRRWICSIYPYKYGAGNRPKKKNVQCKPIHNPIHNLWLEENY